MIYKIWNLYSLSHHGNMAKTSPERAIPDCLKDAGLPQPAGGSFAMAESDIVIASAAKQSRNKVKFGNKVKQKRRKNKWWIAAVGQVLPRNDKKGLQPFYTFAMTAAFSLVEMLMALLVVSLLMTALAPVMTRKTEVVNYEQEKTLDDGVAIYANPGTYAFEVPSGVENIKVQASGGGGGGGGASYKTYTETYTDSKTFLVPKGVYEISFTLTGAGGAGGNAAASTGSDACESGTNRIPSAADSSRDLCVHNGVPPKTVYTVQSVAAGESCTSDNCCWRSVKNDYCTGSSCYERGVCKYNGASYWCGIDWPFYGGIFKEPARLLTETEMQRIYDTKSDYMGSKGLNLCLRANDGENPFGLERCGLPQQCYGSDNNHCYPMEVWLQGRIAFNYWEHYRDKFQTADISVSRAKSVICVRELQDWFPYSGGGGASASKFTYKINVSPNDILQLALGKKGDPASSNKDGGTTYLYHKDSNGNLIGTYFAKGGAGGKNASSSLNGGQTPAGSPSCSAGGTCEFATANPDGLEGTTIGGGAGGGGTEASNYDAPDGRNGIVYGAGGSGGSCQRGYKNSSYCKKGGFGGASLISITYSMASPGGGGGAGGSIGFNDESNNSDMLIIPVRAKSVVNVIIGAGGGGGGVNSNGADGKDTIISTKEKVYYFKGGLGGRSGEFDGNAQKGGAGGAGGNYPDHTSKDYKELTAPLTAKGVNGGMDNKGVSGGGGGNTVTGYKGGCGGMEVNAGNNCNSGTENGSAAMNYEITTAKYGGAGGGGGGINTANKTAGYGGAGADGFLKIRWNSVTGN